MIRNQKLFKTFLMVFVLVFFMSGCNGNVPSLSGIEDIEVTVGSEMPDFLENIELVDILLEDVVVDYSSVDMNVIGDYVVTYTLPSDDEAITYEIAVHVVGYPTTVEPIIFGVKNVVQVVGETRINLMDGVTAVDREYGDLTHRVIVTENIEWSTPGLYDVRYQVENIDGYSVFEVATVEVAFDDMNLTLPNEFIIVEQDGLYGLKTQTGGELVPLEYDHIEYIGEGVLLLEKNDNVYYYNSSKLEFIQYDYYLTGPFMDGLVIVMNEPEYGPYVYKSYGYSDTRYSYMNSAGELLMPFIYTNARPFIDGFAIVQMRENYGVIDKSGNVVVEVMYDYISKFIGDTFITQINGGYEVVDTTGELIVELSADYYTVTSNYDESLIYTVQINDNAALLDEDLNVIVESKYENISLIMPGYYYAYDFTYDYGSVEFVQRAWQGLPNPYKTFYNVIDGTSIDDISFITQLEKGFLYSTKDGWGLYNLETGVVDIEPSYKVLQQLYGSDNLYVAKDDSYLFGVITNEEEIRFDFQAYRVINNDTDGSYMGDPNMYEAGFYVYIDEHGDYGLLNLQGIKSTTNTYQSIGNFVDGWALVQDKDTLLYGYLTDDQYDNEYYGYSTILYSASEFENGYALIKVVDEDQGWTILNSDGYHVSDTLYYYVSSYEDGMAQVRTSANDEPSRYAYIDENGVEKLSGFSETRSFKDGFAVVKFNAEDSGYGMINKEGKEIIPGICDSIGSPVEGMIRFSVGGLSGFYNTNGTLAVDNIYNVVYNFSYDRAIAVKYNEQGHSEYFVIDKTGAVIFESGTTQMYSYSNGLARRATSKVTYYDVDGEVALKTDWKTTKDFRAGIAYFKDVETGLFGFFNTDGEIVSEAQYGGVFDYMETSRYISVTTTDFFSGYHSGLIDMEGNVVIEPRYKILSIFSSVINYTLEDEWGNIEEWKTIDGVLSQDFTDVDGKVYTKGYDRGWMIYDGDNVVVSGLYDDVDYDMYKDMFVTKQDGLFGLYDKDGVMILEPVFTGIDYEAGDDYIIASINNNWGVYNLEGKEMVPPVYDYIYYDVNSNTFRIENGGIYGLYAYDGTMIVELEYNSVVYIDTESEIMLK